MVHCPRLTLAGLSGGAGKSLVSLGIARAWRDQGLTVQPFKKGPDYIDATWLGLAAQVTSTNLDPFFLDDVTLSALFLERSAHADVAVIEGNRGLHDGLDLLGSASTARLARLLRSPVVLVLDVTKMTRTAAAVVRGLLEFEPDTPLAGVVLNRVAGPRHEEIVRQAIESLAGVPVLGALPKLGDDPIPERHMGLISNRELEQTEEILIRHGDIARAHLDLDRLLELARSAPDMEDPGPTPWPASQISRGQARPRIGFVRDAVLWFYYQENLDALERAGAELVELSLLNAAEWPELHGLYLGGGFPETNAQALTSDAALLGRLRGLAGSGMPIYAECGGFMVLCESLVLEEGEFPMAGVLPVKTRLCRRPQGLGYVEAVCVKDSVFHKAGERLKGHEFHYSHCVAGDAQELDMRLRLEKGQGMIPPRDGLAWRNVFAAYTHIHALAAPEWAPRFVRAAMAFREETAGRRVG